MDASGEYLACAVCGRTLLRGELASDYLDDDRERVGVCALCKPRAEASGWVPAALAGTVAEPASSRRRLGIADGLRERLGRAAAAARPPRPASPPEDEGEREQTESAPRAVAPIEAFNSSDERRKVAGLTKSLGAPRVTVREDVITVAWELSWYQWRVRGSQVSQTAKGTEISELEGADRVWNASAATDGTLSLA